MSTNPNPEQENSAPFNSRRATEFILFVLAISVFVALAGYVADVI